MDKETFASYITNLCRKSIILEAATTPKPGLVDRLDSGAHKDMDFFTFLMSSSSIYKGLKECAMKGLGFDKKNSSGLMEIIREPGVISERAMFKATGNVNTHKGMIFSMGILLAATGRLKRKMVEGFIIIEAEKLCLEAKNITKGICQSDFKDIEEKKLLSHGEQLYLKYGVKGIRGEAESGFPTVINYGLPIIREWSKDKDITANELFIQVLMNIMAHNDDTNVLARSDEEGLKYTKDKALEFISLGGVKNIGYKSYLQELNEIFIKMNVSPGGTADLLAVTIFLAFMEGSLNYEL